MQRPSPLDDWVGPPPQDGKGRTDDADVRARRAFRPPVQGVPLPANPEILRFLRALHPKPDPRWWLELKTKRHGANGAHQSWFPASELDAVGCAAAAASARGEHVWFAIQPRIRDGGGTNEDVTAYVGAFVDLDCGDRKPHRTKADAFSALVEFAFVAPPTLVIDSGGGYHAYWLFKEAMGKNERERHIAIQSRLVRALKGDPKLSSPHSVMRIPGTVNPKPERHGARAHILQCNPDRRWNPSDLEDVLPALPTTSAIPRSHRGPNEVPHATELAPRVARALATTGWHFRVKRRPGCLPIALLATCSACAAEPLAAAGAERETAHVTPYGGRLRCKREKCPAGPARSGIDPRTGEALGIELAEWVATYAPHAASALCVDGVGTIWPSAEPSERCDSLTEAQARLPNLLADGIAWANEAPGRVAIVSGSFGLGKSRSALRYLGNQAAQGLGYGTFSAASHARLDELEVEAARDGLDHRQRWRGRTAARKVGGCVYEATLTPWAKQGHLLRALACRSCGHRTNYRETGRPCPAYLGVEGTGVCFVTHAHLPLFLDDLASPIIVDELPPLVTTRSVTIEALQILTAEHVNRVLGDWCSPRCAVGRVIRRVARQLIDEWQAAPQLHPQRISGHELRTRCEAAAAELAANGRAEIPAGLDGRGAGELEEILQDLASTLEKGAGQRLAMPPGWEILEGTARANDWPRGDTDEILAALLAEFVPPVAASPTTTACLVIGRSGVRIEWRRRTLDDWFRPNSDGRIHSYVVLDATAPAMRTAVEAALPGREVRHFRLDVSEPEAAARRIWIATAGASRQRLFRGRDQLRRRALPMVARILRAVGRALPSECGNVGIITHSPLARIISAAMARLDGRAEGSERRQIVDQAALQVVLAELRGLRANRLLRDLRVLHYGGQRGFNSFEDVNAVVLIGEPWPDVGAVAEDARTLGIDRDPYARALCDSETMQAFGRARTIRRSAENPVTLIYVGRAMPPNWAGYAADTIVLPVGGPSPSEATSAAQDLARWLAAHLGAASVALIRWLGQNPQHLAGLVAGREKQSDTTVDIDAVHSSHVRLLLEAVSRLHDRALSRAVASALPDLPAVQTADPTRIDGGRWVWRQLQPRAAIEMVAAIRGAIISESGTYECERSTRIKVQNRSRGSHDAVSK